MNKIVTYGALLLGFLLSATATKECTAPSTIVPYKKGDTRGCGVSQPNEKSTRFITSGSDRRSYSFHLPDGYSADKKYPAILGFHGSSSIGLFFELDTNLDDKKYTGDKIMVYPNGLGGAWAGANYSEATLSQDLTFVWDLLADLRQNFCIDSARIYATGLSAGGGFVNTIACNATVGGEFAAFAPASGSFYTDNDETSKNCEPARVPTPIIEFHGGADESVRYSGGEGEGGIEPSIPNWLHRWALRNQCDMPNTQEDLFNGEVHHLSWNCKGQTGALQHYKSDKQKHDWASTDINFSQISAGDLPAHISASAIIQDFFKNFVRPA